jgi:hypothetical protein
MALDEAERLRNQKEDQVQIMEDAKNLDLEDDQYKFLLTPEMLGLFAGAGILLFCCGCCTLCLLQRRNKRSMEKKEEVAATQIAMADIARAIEDDIKPVGNMNQQ